jgi:hypothetical protein
MTTHELSLSNRVIYFVIFMICILVSVELLASTGLIYLYRIEHLECITRFEVSHISIVNLIDKATRTTLKFAGLCPHCLPDNDQNHRMDVDPSPFFRVDPKLGYRPQPGSYTVTYSKKEAKSWSKLRVNVRINADGSRWTGNSADPNKPSLFIFGDSLVFGEGVNDEQTFSFLLQQAMPNFNVRLFAAGGYSLSQAFLNFERLRDQISDRDAIILGYADFYDKRHVVAPSWLRELEDTKWQRGAPRESGLLPKASVDPNGVVSFSYIQQDCSLNRSYCEQLDPTKEAMQKVTAALANHIAENTNAKLYLLHFSGVADNPVLHLLNKRFTLISALPSDFDYLIRDDVMGFDRHPGPYWHHAIFRKLLGVLGGE